MATLEPSVALTTCETALRELMSFVYEREYGPSWLSRVTTPTQREDWSERATKEQEARASKGVIAVPESGLSYSNFYDLINIAKKHWEPLSTALGRRRSVLPLLERFEDLRNTVGHSRPLVAFERDLLSGIASQIRNQVTIYMSAQDDAGDIYPRIESVVDSFGRRIESSSARGELAGSIGSYDVVVRPGDTVLFECIGVDPQDRQMVWDLTAPNYAKVAHVVAPSGQPASITWAVENNDVNETGVVQIHMTAHEAQYHRFGWFDHRVYFTFRVRPPLP